MRLGMDTGRVFLMIRPICIFALGVSVFTAPVHAEEPVHMAGDVFQDCNDCPKMVVIPPGSFIMGSPPNEPMRQSNEGPQRRVTMRNVFAVGMFEVTQREWKALMSNNPSHFKGSDKPVEVVSWNDTQAYLKTLSRKTGKNYRLLTEAEWEYVARAGTTTSHFTGDRISKSQARFNSSGTVPVGSFAANSFGVHDMIGNVWEWVEDCYRDSYQGAPIDGSALISGSCNSRVIRGSAWYLSPGSLRSAHRAGIYLDSWSHVIGFRVARSM